MLIKHVYNLYLIVCTCPRECSDVIFHSSSSVLSETLAIIRISVTYWLIDLWVIDNFFQQSGQYLSNSRFSNLTRAPHLWHFLYSILNLGLPCPPPLWSILAVKSMAKSRKIKLIDTFKISVLFYRYLYWFILFIIEVRTYQILTKTNKWDY